MPSCRTAAALEEDLRLGADPRVVLALLDAAEALTSLRGLEIGVHIDGIRRRIVSWVGRDRAPVRA